MTPPISRRQLHPEGSRTDAAPCETPLEDLRKNALAHYTEISDKACHWSSVVPRAIEEYFDRRIAERGASRNSPDAQVNFQSRVGDWLLACFGEQIASDPIKSNHRFLEESLELVQACGCTASEAHQLVGYVFGRPSGDKHQETGGVAVTLAALCRAQNIDMAAAGETELARIWTKVETIRAKQAAKPKHSPLPVDAQVGAIELHALHAEPVAVSGTREQETRDEIELHKPAEEYINWLFSERQLPCTLTDHERTLIAGNIRGFMSWLLLRAEAPVDAAIDAAQLDASCGIEHTSPKE